MSDQTAPAFLLTVPESHPSLAGHFPHDPLIPGAVLLDWVWRAFLQTQPDRRLLGVDAVKFLGAVRAGNALFISLDVQVTRVDFRLYCNETVVLHGRFRYG